MSNQGHGHFMTKCSKVRLQVSVLRTNGPLVSVIREVGLGVRSVNMLHHGDPTVNIGIKYDFPFINIR